MGIRKDLNKLKKAKLLEKTVSAFEELENLRMQVANLESESIDFKELVEELKCCKEDEALSERLIKTIEKLDPKFNREIDLTNNYLEKVY